MYLNLNTNMIGVRATFAQTIDYAVAYGFGGIDISIVEVVELTEQVGNEHVRSMLDHAGIAVGGWGMPVNFRGDEETWRAGLAALPKQAKTAQALGALQTATAIIPSDDRRDFDANYRFHVERLRPIAEILADYDCRFGLEFVGPKTMRDEKRFPFVHTMSGMLELCDSVGVGNLGLLLDLYHHYTAHGEIAEIDGLHPDQIVAVHVNDAPAGLAIDEQLDLVRDLPGATGVTDVSGFLQRLHAIGYSGPVTAEPFSQRLNELPDKQALEETSAAMHRVWQMAGL